MGGGQKREQIEEILKRELKLSIFYSNNADLIVCISGCKKGCAAEKVGGNFVHFDEWVGEDNVLTKIKAKLLELPRS